MANVEENAITEKQETELSAPTLTTSQRFTNKVMAEYAMNAAHGVAQVSDSQRRIIQGYFVIIDRALKTAEEERLRKNAANSERKYDNLIPYTWDKVNLTDLALDAVHYARIGLDMQEKNHLFPIPYANKKNGTYNMTFMVGYSGIQFMAEKYATTPPKSVTIEVVYSNDKFTPIKKNRNNPIENYDFEILNPFDRGDVIGGFGYIEYDEPSKNTLVIMSKEAMDKRKPKYASANFWGGTTTVYEKGKKVEAEVEGWQDEMYRKTLVREVYSSKYISRDPSKVDDDYQYLREREVVYAQQEAENESFEYGNSIPIDTTPNDVIDQPTKEVVQATVVNSNEYVPPEI